MEGSNILKKVLTSAAHFPTWLFIIGYPVFWLELYVFQAKDGVTSFLSFGLLALVFLFLSWNCFKAPEAWWKPYGSFRSSLERNQKLFYVGGGVLCGFILLLVVLAGFKPIHLVQESDCLQYHYTLPRQHLILGSFTHIPWAADDLFLLPLDFALAPFWFATSLPNKFPQLIVLFGLMAVLLKLTIAMAGIRRLWVSVIVLFAFLGSHGLGIQMGTGMLDLVVAYLFLASLDSFRSGRWGMGTVEFCFFFWSKPLMPLQVSLVLGLLVIALSIFKRFKWDIIQEFPMTIPLRAGLFFILLSMVIAGPFIGKSIYYAATPFFPLAPGMMGDWAKIQTDPHAWDSLRHASDLWMNAVKDGYGHGRGFLDFINHWWLLAVPQKGVNNAFDYPLGLPYLLFVGPFLFYFVKDLYHRKFYPLSALVIIIWALWWFGSQQARFLYIPVLLIFMIVPSRFLKIPKGLVICLMVALSMQIISLWGAHKGSIFLPPLQVIREEDKKLVEMSHSYLQQHRTDIIELSSHDVAYAQFPAVVTKENLPHTVAF